MRPGRWLGRRTTRTAAGGRPGDAHVSPDVDARTVRAGTHDPFDDQIGGVALADAARVERDLWRESHHVDARVDLDPSATLLSIGGSHVGHGRDVRKRPVVAGADHVAELPELEMELELELELELEELEDDDALPATAMPDPTPRKAMMLEAAAILRARPAGWRRRRRPPGVARVSGICTSCAPLRLR